jgi:hypothetical protein
VRSWYSDTRPMTSRTAAILVLTLYLLHQDFWFWRTAHPIVFGIFPIGLFYHVAYMLVTAALLSLLVARAWPSHLDDEAADR